METQNQNKKQQMITIKDAELFEEFAREDRQEAQHETKYRSRWLEGRATAFELAADHIRRRLE